MYSNKTTLACYLTLFALIIVATVSLLIKIPTSYAQEKPDLRLFVQEGCPYCEQVEDEIVELGLEEFIEITIYDLAKDPSSMDIFYESVELCKTEARLVPTLYFDGNCTTNAVNVINTLKRYAGIPTNNNEERDHNNDEADSLVTQEQEPTQSEETLTKLSDLLDEPPQNTLPQIPFYAYIIIIGALFALVAIGYILINKMKV